MSEWAAWQPTDGMTAFDGSPLAADIDFFAPPPAEIGPIASAYSTLKIGEGPAKPWIRVLAITVLGLAAGIVVGFSHPMTGTSPIEAALILGGAAGFISFGIAVMRRVPVSCRYVGRDGVASFGWGSNQRVATEQTVLLFRDTISLRMGLTNQYVHGVFVSTSYSFRWERLPPAVPFVFSGSCPRNPRRKPYPVQEPLNFGYAAERAWTAFEYARIIEEFERLGTARFDLLRGDFVLVTPERVELQKKGRLTTIPMKEVESIEFEPGVVILRLHGSIKTPLISIGKGVYRIPFKDLANPQVLQLLLGEILARRNAPPKAINRGPG
jgi:hypothetical protein